MVYRNRVFAVFLIVCLILCGCGGGKPDTISQEMYDIGLAALETADDYIAGKITAAEAEKKLLRAESMADSIYEREKEENGGTMVGFKFTSDLTVPSNILLLETSISAHDFGTGSMSSVKERRDIIANQLGK